jgi:chromosome segregation ATPase
VKTPKGDGESVAPSNAAIPDSPMLSSAESVSVDKIRDLLFGNQMQDYDRRFAAMEERFLHRLKDIESEGARNLAAFETSTKKQVDSVAGQLREEKDARAEADKELERNLRETTQSLEKRVRQLSDQLGQIERDFAERVTQESQALRDEIRRRNDDMRAGIERMFAELGSVKTDRNLLAGLFAEVARCLGQETGAKNAGKGNGIDPARAWPSS